MPGAISASLSVNTVNKVLNTFLPIMSYYMVDDAIIPLPFDKETFFYSVHIEDLHVEHFNTGKINFGFVPGTNKLKFSLDGADLKFNLDGQVTVAEIINLAMYHCNLINVGANIEMGIDTKDQVNWQLDVNPDFSLGDFNVTTDSSVANWLLETFNNYVTDVARMELPLFEKGIHKKADKLNKKLKHKHPRSF